MANKYYFKGTDIYSIVQSGNSTIPTTSFVGFPPYTQSTEAYSRINTDMSYSITNTSITSNFPISAAVTTITATSINAAQNKIDIPEWADSMRFIIHSSKGANGPSGNNGSTGAKGAKGESGTPMTVKKCPPNDNKDRPRNGGPGGEGGAGGEGGSGRPGGEGGEGGYIYVSTPIPINSTNVQLSYNIGNENATILNIGDNYKFTVNRGMPGNAGDNGTPGNDGHPGTRGGDGGKTSCNQAGTGDSGSPGGPGTKGARGANPGNKGAIATFSIPPTITSNTGYSSETTSKINVYFFKT
jgi:hypothetical protein